MDLSFQLYSARETSDWDQTLADLVDIGYSQVEGFFGVYDDPAGFRALMDAKGLTMPSGHFSIDDIESDADAVAALAKTLGVKTIYAPFIMPDDRPTDAAGWQAFAKRLAAAGEAMAAHGFGFGWHNHDFEFVTLEDGSTPMQIILDQAPNISWEADIAWIVRSGSDPSVWIAKYGSRITSVHLKDIAPNGENTDEDGWADVGEGVMPWADLLAQSKSQTKAETFVMEHDKPADIHRFASRAFANVSRMSS